MRPLIQPVRQPSTPLALRLRWPTAPVCLHALRPPISTPFQPASPRHPQQLPAPHSRQRLSERGNLTWKKININKPSIFNDFLCNGYPFTFPYTPSHPPPLLFFKFPLNYIYNCYDRFLQLLFFSSLSFCSNIWWWAHQNLATCLNSFGQLWLLLFFFFADVIPADYQNALPIIMVVTIQGWYFVPS